MKNLLQILTVLLCLGGGSLSWQNFYNGARSRGTEDNRTTTLAGPDYPQPWLPVGWKIDSADKDGLIVSYKGVTKPVTWAEVGDVPNGQPIIALDDLPRRADDGEPKKPRPVHSAAFGLDLPPQLPGVAVPLGARVGRRRVAQRGRKRLGD